MHGLFQTMVVYGWCHDRKGCLELCKGSAQAEVRTRDMGDHLSIAKSSSSQHSAPPGVLQWEAPSPTSDGTLSKKR